MSSASAPGVVPLLILLTVSLAGAVRAQDAPAAPSVRDQRDEHNRLTQVDSLVAEKRFADAARELHAIAEQPADPQAKSSTAEGEDVLRRATQTAKGSLDRGTLNDETRQAARKVLCLARAQMPAEPPPAGQATEPLRVKEGVERPEILDTVKPQYTPQGRTARVSGTVILETVVDRYGCVERAVVLKGLPFGLSETAQTAVRSWTFEPATFEGRPVEVYYVVTVSFQVDEKPKQPNG